jgi:hypothetical protein
MTMMRALGVLACAVVLAGCAQAPDMPAPISQAEAQRRVDENSRSWWESMFPDQPMPVIEPVEYVDPGDADSRLSDCMNQAQSDGDGGAGGYVSGDLTADQAINLAAFVCTQRYPTDLSDPARLGMMSDEQLAWIWRYNQSRLVPCLRLLGFAVTQHPGEYGGSNQGWWIPYYEMTPIPRTDEDWARIDSRCPPSPIGPPLNYRPTQR